MTKAENIVGDRSGNTTSKKTYTANCIGSNDHGSVTLGHLHKPGDVIADVLIQASDGRHSIVLDKDGPRKACTQITAPGRISIMSGEDREEAEDTLMIFALFVCTSQASFVIFLNNNSCPFSLTTLNPLIFLAKLPSS